MKRTLAIMATVTGIASQALPARSGDWTGVYAGLSVGTSTSNDSWTNTAAGDFNDVGKSALYGIQGGANWQIRNIVLGAEADLVFQGPKGSVVCPDPTQVCGHDIKSLSSVRGRVGWLGTPTAMIYLTGGYGWGSVNWYEQDPVTGSTANGGSVSHRMGGLVLGGGLEFLMRERILLKGEYLHYNLGTYTPAATVDFGGMPPTFKVYADTFKLGIGFKY